MLAGCGLGGGLSCETVLVWTGSDGGRGEEEEGVVVFIYQLALACKLNMLSFWCPTTVLRTQAGAIL